MEKRIIFVTGPYSSGKTSFIAAVSEIGVVLTERKIKPNEPINTPQIALDFGRVTVDDRLVLYFFANPGARRFDYYFLNVPELFTDLIGFIVLVDSSKPQAFREAKYILNKLNNDFSSQSYVVAANKQDHEGAWSVEDMRIIMKIPPDVKMIPCVATDKESVKSVLLALCDEILPRLDHEEI